MVGPKVFSLVKCTECGQQYQQKSGKPFEWSHIIVYSLVVGAIGVALLVLRFALAG